MHEFVAAVAATDESDERGPEKVTAVRAEHLDAGFTKYRFSQIRSRNSEHKDTKTRRHKGAR